MHCALFIARLTIFFTGIIISLAAAAGPSWIDSLESRYASAARDYDSTSLMAAVESFNRQQTPDRESGRALLLLGLSYWRLELIGYCADDKTRVIHYGELAISTLTRAEKAGADLYLTASHKALASQLLAAQGALKGMLYGPRSSSEAKKARDANPTGYFSLLTEAVNASQAPKFAGGDEKKAIAALEKMTPEFPDSVDVKIHLARTYTKAGMTEEARNMIAPIVAALPLNLLARKVAAEIPAK